MSKSNMEYRIVKISSDTYRVEQKRRFLLFFTYWDKYISKFLLNGKFGESELLFEQIETAQIWIKTKFNEYQKIKFLNNIRYDKPIVVKNYKHLQDFYDIELSKENLKAKLKAINNNFVEKQSSNLDEKNFLNNSELSDEQYADLLEDQFDMLVDNERFEKQEKQENLDKSTKAYNNLINYSDECSKLKIRKSGKSTRLADTYIQRIFENPNKLIVIESEYKDFIGMTFKDKIKLNKCLFEKIKMRLSIEHKFNEFEFVENALNTNFAIKLIIKEDINSEFKQDSNENDLKQEAICFENFKIPVGNKKATFVQKKKLLNKEKLNKTVEECKHIL
jgi:hypothetical protein